MTKAAHTSIRPAKIRLGPLHFFHHHGVIGRIVAGYCKDLRGRRSKRQTLIIRPRPMHKYTHLVNDFEFTQKLEQLVREICARVSLD